MKFIDLERVYYVGALPGPYAYIYCILIEIRNKFFDLIGWETVRT